MILYGRWGAGELLVWEKERIQVCLLCTGLSLPSSMVALLYSTVPRPLYAKGDYNSYV